jgi:hypothetical protein
MKKRRKERKKEKRKRKERKKKERRKKKEKRKSYLQEIKCNCGCSFQSFLL